MTIEEIILKRSNRGMDILKNYLPRDFCTRAAKKLLSLKRGVVILATGFYVAGYAETDGPAGTYFLTKSLKKAGFNPVIATDRFCEGFFDDIKTIYLNDDFDPEEILKEYDPISLISIERCGVNINGRYENMRGVDISEFTVPIDKLFDLAKENDIYTIGVGDGGNEIGMGNLKDAILKELSLVPCKTETSDLIIATVSNWGAYGLLAEISVLLGENFFVSYDEIFSYLERTVSIGSVDGVTKKRTPTVDGFNEFIERTVVDEINSYIDDKLK